MFTKRGLRPWCCRTHSMNPRALGQAYGCHFGFWILDSVAFLTTSTFIWHCVEGTIRCTDWKPVLTKTLTGSKFPVHPELSDRGVHAASASKRQHAWE